jgi:hypothetical protein
VIVKFGCVVSDDDDGRGRKSFEVNSAQVKSAEQKYKKKKTNVNAVCG